VGTGSVTRDREETGSHSNKQPEPEWLIGNQLKESLGLTRSPGGSKKDDQRPDSTERPKGNKREAKERSLYKAVGGKRKRKN